MSTCNFTQYDEKYIYAIDDVEDDFIIDDIINNITSELERIYKKNGSRQDNYIKESKCFYNITVYSKENGVIDIDIIITGGYYYGANLGYIINNNDDIQISNTLQKSIDSVCNNIERIYKKYTQKIRRVATFSNGEAIYEPVNN